MDSVPKSIQNIQASLEPFIKSREQVAYIRRALALHLQACGRLGSIQSPLSLIDASCTVAPTQEVRGFQKEYLKALDANLKARSEYENTRNQATATGSSRSKNIDTRDQVEEHVSLVKLRQKQQRLLTVQKYLDLLLRQPASSQDFIDLDVVFRDSPPLPNVPTEVVSGFAASANINNTKTDLNGLAAQLEKVVLKAKLLLQREEQLLAEARRRTEPLALQVSDQAKVHALDATRAELINWIETELSKASGESEDHESSQRKRHAHIDQANIDKELAEIKEKYTKYTTARKTLLNVVFQQTQPVLKPVGEAAVAPGDHDVPPARTAHLLIPYLDKLLALSREQKAIITHKSYINTVLAKQAKETRQALDRLADESQLLPGHAMLGAASSTSGFGGDFNSAVSDKPTSSAHTRPWVFAADSAKIATLEKVAEKIEDGQVALEGSMTALHEIDKLLAQELDEPEKEEVGDATEEDIWLTQGSATKASRGRHIVHQRKESTVKPSDIWAAINGKLGLIGHEDRV
ncbi:hypothetical protein CCHL11_01829 [Colletotrichum chlorophyti]|uniref:Uncharacterized protein n=1 Tax=Colletotrichum chlorophyti TaxID=708187 RepID=A0A1Q8RVT1_9PEZI|nr:hypothetical protein CCHL11_01829 [Colletotrichum chlorophyti]